MQEQRVLGDERPTTDGVAFEAPVSRGYVGYEQPRTEIGENVLEVKNRVQWGPIIAGVLTTLATLLLLSVLGLAIGASAFEPTDADETLGTAAGIWGALSAVLSLLAGGWVAAKTAAVGGPGSGLLNGFLVGATTLALILGLSSLGVGDLLGTLGTSLGDITDIFDGTGEEARVAYDNARDGAWSTLGGLALALGSSALGGFLGHNKRRDLIEGTR